MHWRRKWWGGSCSPPGPPAWDSSSGLPENSPGSAWGGSAAGVAALQMRWCFRALAACPGPFAQPAWRLGPRSAGHPGPVGAAPQRACALRSWEPGRLRCKFSFCQWPGLGVDGLRPRVSASDSSTRVHIPGRAVLEGRAGRGLEPWEGRCSSGQAVGAPSPRGAQRGWC